MLALAPLGGVLGGCVAAAAGAGAAGAVYVTERDAEATLPNSVATVEASAKRIFGEMGIKEKRTIGEEGAAGLKRTLEGTLDDRDISVAIQTAGTGSKVVVAARTSPVTWDRDLAKKILEKIVEGTK
jgi:ABC-type xylose transport system substrate-binding protein